MLKDKKFSYYIKKLTPKSLFSATASIYVFLLSFSLVYILFNNHFVNTYESYSFVLVAAAVLFMIKAFVLNYTGMVENLRNNKIILLILNMILFTIEIISAFYVVTSLTGNSYIKYPLIGILCATTIFLIHTILNGFSGLVKSVILILVIYVIAYLTINIPLSPTSSSFLVYLSNLFNSVKYWNLIGEMSVFIELLSLYSVARLFFQKVRD